MKHFAGRPFALIGVNSDEDRAAIQDTVREKDLTWRSFWDGSTKGPISKAWRTSFWPTTVLIDHEGVILGRSLFYGELDAAIARAVVNAEEDAK